MQKISFIFHIFFKLILIFLFVFIWIRYFVKSLLSSLIISSVITFFIDIITRLFFKKRADKKTLKLKEKEDAENMFSSLAMETNYIKFFSKLLKDKQDLNVYKAYLTYNEEDQKIVLFPELKFLSLTTNDIAQIIKKIKKEKPQKVIIVAGEISKQCFNFINIYDEEIILLDKYQTYNDLYKKANCFPEITIKKNVSKKLSIKQLLEFSFNKSRCKSYLISSLALLFCSLFVKTSLYYSIVTSVLVLFAFISLFNPFSSQKQNYKKII